ncbi:MAG TPA: hypothetical protein EYO60_01125, partial [Candidatus Lambdaproteobacteria bacterium]|nr:hypothetical protein [Candidatus Lambdaproteobacteria bacterium]
MNQPAFLFSKFIFVHLNLILVKIHKALCQVLKRFSPPNQATLPMKANSNPSLLKILLEEGSAIDAVSEFEVRLALESGFE